jgi:hypothetical protein
MQLVRFFNDPDGNPFSLAEMKHVGSAATKA